jgi:alkylhydroperoxidase family enzyme
VKQGSVPAGQTIDDNQKELLDFEQSRRFTPREKLALRYTHAIMWEPASADVAMWKDLHAEFSEPELVELGYWAGFTFGGQRWLQTLDTSQGELNAFLEKKPQKRA